MLVPVAALGDRAGGDASLELIGPWQLVGVAVAMALWAPTSSGGPAQLAAARDVAHAARQALHRRDYAGVLPGQLLYVGLANVPPAVLGVRRLAQRRELRFLAMAVALVLAFVAIEIPGRSYCTAGVMSVGFAAGAGHGRAARA